MRASLLLLLSVVLGTEAGGGSSGFRPHEGAHVGHTHHLPKKKIEGGSLLDDDDLVQDREHILEDSNNVLTREQINKMSNNELAFHYFKLHDFDNNHRLDGLELLAALGHVHQHEDGKEGLDDEQLASVEEMIDDVLRIGDRNNDGYVNYGEYRLGRQQGKFYYKQPR